MTIAEYYEKYEPRYDSLTGEQIPFETSYEDYSCTFFVDRKNAKQLALVNPSKAAIIAAELLRARVIHKKLKFVPSYVELASYNLFNPETYFNHVNRAQFAQEYGLVNRFVDENLLQSFIPCDTTILVDTREQKPFQFDYPVIRKKLHEGDYALANVLHSVIERKTLIDLYATMVRSYDRFCRELDRAKSKNIYVVVLVENSLSEALDFTKSNEMKYVNGKPSFMFSSLRRIMQTYDNVQFLFVPNRSKAEKLAIQILLAQNAVRRVDLQQLFSPSFNNL